VARIIVLDAGPLGLAGKAPGNPDGDRCRAWLQALDAAQVRAVAPEIADYEVRRELLRRGATTGIIRLDRLESVLDDERRPPLPVPRDRCPAVGHDRGLTRPCPDSSNWVRAGNARNTKHETEWSVRQPY
jgi:hypothetical protein